MKDDQLTIISGQLDEDPTISIHGYVPLPVSGGMLANYREKVTNTTGPIDLANGSVFYARANKNIDFRFNNAAKEAAHSFTLIVDTDAVVRRINFHDNIKWQNGKEPFIDTVHKSYVMSFLTIDGGATWLGVHGGEF